MDNFDRDFITDVYSSPIPQRTVNEKKGLDLTIEDFSDDYQETTRKSQSRKKGKPGKVENLEEIETWSPAKRHSWESKKTNPNAFYYRHVDPGQVKKTGPWDDDEKVIFLRAIKLHPPTQGKWGLFSMHIPGRVGYQCRNFYHRLLESGEIQGDLVPGEGTEKPVKKEKTQKTPKTPKAPKKQTKGKRKEPKYCESDSDEKNIESEDSTEELLFNEMIGATDAIYGVNSQYIDETIPAQIDDFSISQNDTYESAPIEQETPSLEPEKQDTLLDGDEVEPFNILSLKLFSSRLMKEDNENDQESLINDNDNVFSPSEIIESTVEAVKRFTEEMQQKNNEQLQSGESHIKYTAKMWSPWTSPDINQDIESNKAQYEYQSSRIMHFNNSNPLNLLLLSFPAPEDLRKDYTQFIRKKLAENKEGVQFTEAIKAYYKARDQCITNPSEKDAICRDFVSRIMKSDLF